MPDLAPAPSLIPTYAEALAAWRQRIQANRKQVDALREVGDGEDFYAPVSANFRPADPRQINEPIGAVLQALLQPGETLLDIGAGGGRYALPLASTAREVIAVDPSPSMLRTLTRTADEYGIANVRTIQARWPMADPPSADVSLAANVLYDMDNVDTFLDAMEAQTHRLCVAVLGAQPPPHLVDALWPAVHGVARAELPALPEFLALLLARGTAFEVRLTDRPPTTYAQLDDVLPHARRQTWVRPGSEKDHRLQATLRAQLAERDSRVALSWNPVQIGVVSWAPR